MKNPQASKHYFRQRQRNRLYEDVIKAIELAAATNNVRRKDIAERLEVSPSQISRWLSGPANWGMDTVSDLMFAIDAELDFKVERFEDRAKRNEFHPAGSSSTMPIANKNTGTNLESEVILPYIPLRAGRLSPTKNEVYDG